MEKKIVIILCVLDVILLGFSIFLYVGEDRTPPAIAFSEEAPVYREGMEEAALLLRGGKLSSKEISYRVGYSSPEHFSRTFKAYFGLSPEAWKKANASI